MKDPVVRLIIAIIITFFLMVGCSILFSSCHVLKGKQDKQLQTVAVDSSARGKVSENKVSVNTDWEWYRTTLQLQQPHGDTIINKNYYTSNLPQPQVIIMEGGKGKQEAITENKDSVWDNRLARLEQLFVESTKTKETKMLSAGQIIALVIGAVVLFVLLSKIKIHF